MNLVKNTRSTGIARPTWLKRFVGGATAIAIGLWAIGYSSKANADVYLRTNPPSVMIADGQTIYKVDVVADTGSEEGKKFRSVSYSLGIPAGLTYIKAELPGANEHCYDVANPSDEPSDFFYGFTMQPPGGIFNTVCNSPSPNASPPDWPWRIDGNSRGTLMPEEGPSDRAGIIGSYFFVVNETANPGLGKKFALAGPMMYNTTDSCSYTPTGCNNGSPCTPGNNGCLRQDHPFFSIIPVGDMNMDTLVNTEDVQPFVNAILDPETYYTQRQNNEVGSADMNLDGVVDGRDIQLFVNKLLE